MTANPAPSPIAATPPQTRKGGEAARTLSVLGRYLAPLRWWVLLLAALLLGSTALNLNLPGLLARFVDGARLGTEADLGLLTRLALTYIGFAVAVQLMNAAATYLGARVGWLATNRLRTDLTRHLLSLDMAEHKERTPGELIERIDGDVTALSNFFSQFSVRVFGAALLLLGALVMFWRVNAWIGLGVTLFAAVTLWAMNAVRKYGIEPTRHERENSAQLYSYIEERLAGLDDVRSLGAGPHHLHGFLAVQREFFGSFLASWKARAVVWQLSMGLFALGYIAILASAAWLYAAGSITLGTAFLLYSYMSMVEDPIDQLSQQLQDLQKAGASLGRIGELLALKSGLPSGTQELPAQAPELRFEAVDFRYSPEGERVLKEVDFTLPAGQTLGLLGRTGSGKTTLTRLISRLYDPSGGAVRLDGLNTTDLSLVSLRSRVAVVSQDVQVFQASVRDNLTFFDDRIPDEQVSAALQEVGLGDWLAGLEDGIHTPLPTGSLSAGQSQLLAFARVLLRDPSVVILDEPSSRLDPATEATLTAAMTRLLRGRTAIVIAHRLETVARADQILVLGAGEVLEFGPRETLAADPTSHYAALLRAAAGQGGSEALEDLLS